MTRPRGVPDTATYVPGGDTFAALQEMHESRVNKRAYLRIAFIFVISDITDVMLCDVWPRGLRINRRSWSMGRALVWSDTSRPVPGVWVWTLEEARR